MPIITFYALGVNSGI